MKQGGNGISHIHSPPALFAEFYICSEIKITTGDLESHFLINNVYLCGQNFIIEIKLSWFYITHFKEEYASSLLVTRHPLGRSIQKSCWVS